jgi:hypothetical protein
VRRKGEGIMSEFTEANPATITAFFPALGGPASTLFFQYKRETRRISGGLKRT